MLFLWPRWRGTKTIIHSVWLQEINFPSKACCSNSVSSRQTKGSTCSLNTVIFAKVCQLAQLRTFPKWQVSVCAFGTTFFYQGVSRAEKAIVFKCYLNHFFFSCTWWWNAENHFHNNLTFSKGNEGIMS